MRTELKYEEMLKDEQRRRKNAAITIRMLKVKVKSLQAELEKVKMRVMDLKNEPMLENDRHI